MIVALLLIFIVPLSLILGVLVERAPEVAAWVQQLLREGLPAPPPWVQGLPLVGSKAASLWTELAASGPDGLAARVAPYAEQVAAWVVAQVGGAGMVMLHFALTLLFAAVLYAKGESFANGMRQFARRLAGERGDRAAMLAAQSVRAVAFGVVITSLVQSAIGGLGLLIAGLPVPGLLTAVMFICSIAQIGAAPVLALAAIWLFVQDASGYGVMMIVWTVVVGSLDNVIRPLLIRKGVDLPLLLVFAGVVGGLIAFGPVGLFAGPVVLAVAYTLLQAWIAEAPGEAAAQIQPET
jgi:predicted PurR-regulated permease PerM